MTQPSKAFAEAIRQLMGRTDDAQANTQRTLEGIRKATEELLRKLK